MRVFSHVREKFSEKKRFFEYLKIMVFHFEYFCIFNETITGIYNYQILIIPKIVIFGPKKVLFLKGPLLFFGKSSEKSSDLKIYFLYIFYGLKKMRNL